MDAAEMYLQAFQFSKEHTGNNTNKNNHALEQVVISIQTRLQRTLDRVEQLKRNQNGQEVPRQNQSSSKQQQPKNDPAQSLTPEEVAVLKQSSMTVSGLFLPWSDTDATGLFQEAVWASKESVNNVTRFTDPAGFLKLSDKQKPHFYKWARPDEIVQLRQQTRLRKGPLQQPILIKAVTPYTIKQQYVTDCSFISSLCVTAVLERRLQKSIITSSIYPQTPAQQPIYNATGKYMVKLWLNGVARCVVIDDLLPVDKHGNLLCSQTTDSSKSQYLELWVCFMEKAYMKLCGGYDFPGSNSGVDLFSLTGWIPERIHFAKSADKVRDFETPPERAWDRISSASSFGDCLITVSSHLNLNQAEAGRLGLVMGHAYAVLSVMETKSGIRMLQLKNPWALKGWKGQYSSYDPVWKDKSFCAEVGYNPDEVRHHDDGVFWICWDDILQYFLNFHLSWNPFLFRFRTATHGLWPKNKGPYDDTFNVGDNPQYILKLSKEAIEQKATIWILISRHVSKQEQEGADVSDFLTVHVHRNQGNRETIWYPGRSGNCVLTGAYTNNPHVLVRYDVTDPADQNLSLVLSQYQKSNDLRYTLSVYCTEQFSLTKPRPNLPRVIERTGNLSPDGGPLGSNLVLRNPMFALNILTDRTVVELKVSTAKTIAMNIVALPVAMYGHRMEQATGSAVIDSGKYRHGFLVTERKALCAGAYVLMASSFTAGQIGSFQLKCCSSQQIEFQPLQ